MANRPYLKYRIEEIQALVATSGSDLKALREIQSELVYRDRPKARALKAEVDELVRKLSVGSAIPNAPPVTPARERADEAHHIQNQPTVPDRVIVECANCKAPNFVSTLEGVVQHLSCSVCKSTYEAQFKYDVMRAIFLAKPTTESGNTGTKWILIGLVMLVILVLIAK